MSALTCVSFYTANYTSLSNRLVCAEVSITILSKSWDDTIFIVQSAINLWGYNLQIREALAHTMDAFRGLFVKETYEQTNQKENKDEGVTIYDSAKGILPRWESEKWSAAQELLSS